jgi:hypothetical protein
MKYAPINLEAKLALFSEHFAPKIIAQMNDYMEIDLEPHDEV